MMKPQRLNLDSEALAEFRQSLDAALEIVTCQLVRRKMSAGTVSAKVNIHINERADDKTGEIYYQMVLEPNVSMKVGASDKLKCGTKAAIMKQDNQGRPLIASEQIGMDELMEGAGA